MKYFFSKSPMTPIVRYYILPYFAGLTDILSLDDLATRGTNGAGTSLKVNREFRTPEFAYALAYFATKLDLSKNFLTIFKVFWNLHSRFLQALREVILLYVIQA